MFYLFMFAVLTATELRDLVVTKAKGTVPTPTEIPTIAQGEGSGSVIPVSSTLAIGPIITRSITEGFEIRGQPPKTKHAAVRGKYYGKRPRVTESVRSY